ncbi:NADH-quinone oxidoreductase subunit NuoF [Candidatus Viridilinea mediisalina]|uniref:NADH-quinone oxidoreductase subunit F n=1 Tax=Candidatus Viridilinea mediisalina TaxID=2024553 RepID=A0A2A6RE82_9CHLR|nr:NADH-quinone oxidoreductase subunit NuoF [Candidatus Viridilinea mediisalina]PDW01134.1 NADH-quinone oxidoreductase subunit F [Candidatus Viridilinea mediisalina]
MDISELHAIAERERARRTSIRIHCCTSSGCMASGGVVLHEQLTKAVSAAGRQAEIETVAVGCMGFCGLGPMVVVEPEHLIFERVRPDQAAELVGALAGKPCSIERGDPQHPFFARQLPIVRRNGGQINPERIEEYIAAGGYQALYHAVHDLEPNEVIEELTRSGLRGRGGAGYPTGLKWATVAKSRGERKFVVCNGDEGDPGAFMDRSILESDPHLVLEGMCIAGYAVGASQGYLYVRGEYPLAISRLQKAIGQARRLGILGSQIFDTAFDFKIDIRVGAGAFVCGEETALIASIEGRRGQPRPRPPYPAEQGLWGFPTLINNVETLANIAPIINGGADWYASIGTAQSKGTKVFALTGKVRNTGLIEVPMGISLREIVEDLGGGTPDGVAVKAVQTGGPSGGCIPASLFHTAVSYETLAEVGSIMGSGGMVVMDASTDMVELARFYVDFCMDESCGKCIPCRVGTIQLHRLLSRIRAGEASRAELDDLEQLCNLVRDTSLCGLGQSAPNPVLSTLRYFREEYEALCQPEP